MPPCRNIRSISCVSRESARYREIRACSRGQHRKSMRWAATRSRWAVSRSGAPFEQAGHRTVAEDLLDGPRDERRDREHGELVETLLRGNGQRAGDDDLA